MGAKRRGARRRHIFILRVLRVLLKCLRESSSDEEELEGVAGMACQKDETGIPRLPDCDRRPVWTYCGDRYEVRCRHFQEGRRRSRSSRTLVLTGLRYTFGH